MEEHEIVLFDAPLIPDPDVEQDLGAGSLESIADEEVKGSRLLIVLQAVETINLGGALGGAIKLACSFHPPQDGRFKQARLHLTLASPEGIKIVDLQPRIGEGQPVKIIVSSEGKLEFGYKVIKAADTAKQSVEFEQQHRLIQGSGAGTARALWDFREDPVRQNGIPGEQTLALTLPVTGKVTGRISVSTRLVRTGLRGGIEAIRDLILGKAAKGYEIAFEISNTLPHTGASQFYLTT